MKSAAWDVNAAVGAIQPDVLCSNKPAHRTFAFQSYLCQKMFSNFQHKSYNLAALEDRVKYLALVHPKMELCFFGNLDHRAMVISDQGFPSSAFFDAFTKMARRMWLLHCLFFSFERESD
ncbi:hypothetical protein MUK42_24219 [Musa troglodytarum]|uniref:Uncharacterized protein n=1 Tax=Musa troglodytarum TaxID=320322 RepID=A0A9E7JMN2_9LILI|nr:hypothetical protein MUK42_24219 [Musa troglodytarum]